MWTFAKRVCWPRNPCNWGLLLSIITLHVNIANERKFPGLDKILECYSIGRCRVCEMLWITLGKGRKGLCFLKGLDAICAKLGKRVSIQNFVTKEFFICHGSILSVFCIPCMYYARKKTKLSLPFLPQAETLHLHRGKFGGKFIPALKCFVSFKKLF